MEQVFRTLAANVSRTRDLLFAVIPLIPERPHCACHSSGAAGLTGP
jgi:hypothetical protein